MVLGKQKSGNIKKCDNYKEEEVEQDKVMWEISNNNH